jgi:transcriptional regulator with XRE-family HTH domain
MTHSRPKQNVAWHLAEWMAALRASQADMMERAGWSKATASLLYNCRQDLSSKLIFEAALALNIEPFELFMLPEQAMALRRLRDDAIRIAADKRNIWGHFPADQIAPAA